MMKLQIFLVVILAIVYFYVSNNSSVDIPVLSDITWKSDDTQIDDKKIYPFSIKTSPETIRYLQQRLQNTTLTPPLNGVNFEYGFNTNHMKGIIDFWINKYKWDERQKLLNSMPQFRTKISGLYIHFLHVKPDAKVTKSKKVLPLLLLHGWPGSVKEFYEVIPQLIQPKSEYDFVFEIIAPSLPGYGFSDPATLPGMNAAHIGLVMKKLMNRLGYQKFYVQGGDWGALIGASMATLFPESVIGFHSNMCFAPYTAKSISKLIFSSFFPNLFVSNEIFRKRLYPLSHHLSYMLEESGYFHLQASKPDTIGVGLTDSPAGLAAYILEKFSTWTDFNWRKRSDGGLLFNSKLRDSYSIENLLDNVMIYWITNSITTSMRLYSEEMNFKTFSLQIDKIPTEVPTACANYPYDITYSPEFLVKEKFRNLVDFEHMPRGGHFAAFEEPNLFAANLWKSICKIENKIGNKNLNC